MKQYDESWSNVMSHGKTQIKFWVGYKTRTTKDIISIKSSWLISCLLVMAKLDGLGVFKHTDHLKIGPIQGGLISPTRQQNKVEILFS